MKRLHLAISTHDIDATIGDYTERLGCEPCLVVPGEYALWRNECLNLSVRLDHATAPGSLRHLGHEDPAADAFSTSVDCNGITWERFSVEQQLEEIDTLWPERPTGPIDRL